MSDSPEITIKVSSFISPTELQQRLLNIIGDDEVKTGVNKIIGERANKYVPMESGDLRKSMEITPTTISWGSGLDYGRYQYNGVVYARNIPITSLGTIVGWFSRPGVTKTPTDRELGVPHEWKGWPFGYKTPGTKHHWIDEMMRNERRGMMNQITNYLKREAKKRDV